MQAWLSTGYGDFRLRKGNYKVEVRDGTLFLRRNERDFGRIVGHLENPTNGQSTNGQSLEIIVTKSSVTLANSSNSDSAHFHGRRLEREEIAKPDRYRISLAGYPMTVEFDFGLREAFQIVFQHLNPLKLVKNY